jgi:hypothetical protein
MSIYRHLYEQHFGPIPKDEEGRSFEIHHIDGDKNNNDLSNLVALSIQEHYNIHYKQGDWIEARAAAIRMQKSPKLISELAAMAAQKRVEEGTHHFLDSEFHRRNNKKRIDAGTHHFLGSKVNLKKVEMGIHPWQNKPKQTCPNCGKTVDISNYARWHGDSCKQKVNDD